MPSSSSVALIISFAADRPRSPTQYGILGACIGLLGISIGTRKAFLGCLRCKCGVIWVWGHSVRQPNDDWQLLLTSTQGTQHYKDAVHEQGGCKMGLQASECAMTNTRIRELATCF